MTPQPIAALDVPLAAVEAAVSAPPAYSRPYSIPLVNAAVGDDPGEINTSYWTTERGQNAALHVGQNLILSISFASPEALRRLSEAAAELADWRERQLGGAS